MRRTAYLTIAAIAALAGPVIAKTKATFIGPGTYSPGDGCQKFAALAAGTMEPDIATYPDKLTSDGYQSWEGGCSFTSIKKTGTDMWTVKMDCAEGSTESQETTTIKKLTDDRFEVSGGGFAQIYERCDAVKGQ